MRDQKVSQTRTAEGGSMTISLTRQLRRSLTAGQVSNRVGLDLEDEILPKRIRTPKPVRPEQPPAP
jgi:hypothetical protein